MRRAWGGYGADERTAGSRPVQRWRQDPVASSLGLLWVLVRQRL